jgi:hypothetical protein
MQHQTEPYPLPTGMVRKNEYSTNWIFWNRYTTNYSSGGSGPSLRWDNPDVTWRDMVAGFEFRIGPTHGERGDDEVSLKFPRCSIPKGDRGVYLSEIKWFVTRANSIGQTGSEWPHPTTSHSKFNADNPNPYIGDIKDGRWHGFLAACYNDSQNSVVIKLWYNPTASGMFGDYVYLGSSIDSSDNILPIPTARYGSLGHSGGTHPMGIRIDEVPASDYDRLGENEWANLGIRNMFACEIQPVA